MPDKKQLPQKQKAANQLYEILLTKEAKLTISAS
jgi:hypothetical protein